MYKWMTVPTVDKVLYSYIDRWQMTSPMLNSVLDIFPFDNDCLCANSGLISREISFLDFSGIECISLGALSCALTPWERVFNTTRQLSTIAEKLVSISFVVDDQSMIESIPLEIVIQGSVITTLPSTFKKIVRDMKVCIIFLL